MLQFSPFFFFMARIEICPGKGKLQRRLLGGWDADEKACDWAEARRADKIR